MSGSTDPAAPVSLTGSSPGLALPREVSLPVLQTLAFDIACHRGQGDPPAHVREALLHLYDEVGEVVAEFNRGRLDTTRSNGKPVGLPSELADIVILCSSIAGYLDIDLNAAVKAKLRYNYRRAFPKAGPVIDPNQQPLFGETDW